MHGRTAPIWMTTLLAVLACAAPAAAYSPMWGVDPQRTHQSTLTGPTTAPTATNVTRRELGCELNVNTPATIDAAGNLFFGSWGTIRSDGALPTDPVAWTKFDGRLHGFGWDLAAPLWPAVEAGPVPLCYAYDGREDGECPPGQHVNGLNGTVEGAPALGPDGVLYVGRGDGRLYAIDPVAGQVLWSFRTFNPLDPADPEGGGQIITPPLVHDGVVYFATWAPSDLDNSAWETNAIYGVDVASHGASYWRYPSDAPSLAGEPFVAAPVLSADGGLVYFGSFDDFVDAATAIKHLYAFHTVPVTAPESERVAFVRPTADPARPASTILVQRLVGGGDGSLFLGGVRVDTNVAPGSPFTNPTPVVLRLTASGEPAWSAAVELPSSATDGRLVLGLSLRQASGVPQTLYAGQGNNSIDGGALAAITASSGAIAWRWRNLDHAMQGQVGDATIGADGTLYFGVRGVPGLVGWIVALTSAGQERWRYVLSDAVDWSAPVIGREGSLVWGDRAVEDLPTTALAPDTCPLESWRPHVYVMKKATGCGSVAGAASGSADAVLVLAAIGAYVQIAGRRTLRRSGQ